MAERINDIKRANLFIEKQISCIKKDVGQKKVILALSGGVDSSVVAVLLSKAIGKNLICIHVNHGLLRKNESAYIIKKFKKELKINLVYVNASKIFLKKLKNVEKPDIKRKIIGRTFIDVFQREANKYKGIKFLAQGTIYPDIVESKNLKPHHNVGGLPKKMKLKLIEPLKYLYKDEVRQVGLALGLQRDIVFRQPFPGPGLGVRCLGKITSKKLIIARESDEILRDEFKKNNLEYKVWEYFTVVSKYTSIGIKNNKKFVGYVVILRAVNSIDATKATIEEIPYIVLNKIANRILTNIKNVSRVTYDLTPKPCGTIEWE